MSVLIDSYSESNSVGGISVSGIGGFSKSAAQSFKGNGGELTSVKFYLENDTSATGSAYAKIYASTGTYGTNAIPTGSALATSGAFDVSALSSFELIEFTFTGENQITLEDGIAYCVAIEFNVAGEAIGVGFDNSSPTHSGNAASTYDLSSWRALNYDVCFYVYGEPITTPIVGNKYPLPAFKR